MRKFSSPFTTPIWVILENCSIINRLKSRRASMHSDYSGKSNKNPFVGKKKEAVAEFSKIANLN